MVVAVYDFAREMKDSNNTLKKILCGKPVKPAVNSACWVIGFGSTSCRSFYRGSSEC